MGEHMADYWNDSGIIRTGVTEFWESFGYESGKKWWEPASDEPRFVKRRQLNIPQAIQCGESMVGKIVDWLINGHAVKFNFYFFNE